MTDTFVVLGIDAADYNLVRKWNCENMLLSNHDNVETFSHSLDVPATYEVWPTIASGVLPDEHGVTLPSNWDERSLPFRVLAKVGAQLPGPIKSYAVRLKQRIEGDKSQSSVPNMFHNGEVYNWPGLTLCHDWEEEGEWFRAVKRGEMSQEEFRRKHLGNAGKGLGWLAGMNRSTVPVAGVHIHILDHMGHIYANRPEKLKAAYNDVNELVGWLRKQVDRLLVISDHGMQTTATDDPEPGVHSFRSMIATTEEGELPTEVSGVCEWVESRIETNSSGTTTEIDAPVEHLKDLGYL